MFNTRSEKKELMDDLTLNSVALQHNLDEIEKLNQMFGAKKTLLNALAQIFKNRKEIKQSLIFADLGCGGGDLLRAVSKWTKAKKINAHLLGIDA
jgi:hypothetical protein